MELLAAAHTCELAEEMCANVYMDLKYVFRIYHRNGKIWKQRGFLTSAGTSVANGYLISWLLDTIELPAAIAVIHVPAHTGENTFENLSNAKADETAKLVAFRIPIEQTGVQDQNHQVRVQGPFKLLELSEESYHLIKYILSFAKLLKVLHKEVQNAQVVPSDSNCHDTS